MAWALLKPTPSSDVAMVCASSLLTLTGVAANAGSAMAKQSASAQSVCLNMSGLPGEWIAPAMRRVQTGCRGRGAVTVRHRSSRMSADSDGACGDRPIGRLLHWAIAYSQEVVHGCQQGPRVHRKDLGRRSGTSDHRVHQDPQ